MFYEGGQANQCYYSLIVSWYLDETTSCEKIVAKHIICLTRMLIYLLFVGVLMSVLSPCETLTWLLIIFVDFFLARHKPWAAVENFSICRRARWVSKAKLLILTADFFFTQTSQHFYSISILKKKVDLQIMITSRKAYQFGTKYGYAFTLS